MFPKFPRKSQYAQSQDHWVTLFWVYVDARVVFSPSIHHAWGLEKLSFSVTALNRAREWVFVREMKWTSSRKACQNLIRKGEAKKMCVERKKKSSQCFRPPTSLMILDHFWDFFLSLLGNMEVTSNFLSPCSRLWCREVFNKAPCFSWWPSLVQVWFYCFWLKAVSELTEQILL